MARERLAARPWIEAAHQQRNFVITQATNKPKLMLHSDTRQLGARCVDVENIDPHLLAGLGGCEQVGQLLRSILRVRVAEAGGVEGEDLPDVFGRYQVLQGGIRFTPHFPFESGVRYRASFDPRPLGRPELSEVGTLDFSFPREITAVSSEVKNVFPSADSLPENLLRFYACFSNSMQRGQAEAHIRLLGPDGEPAPDVLYRPPVELWDRSMRHLTILLDPGRLKREVGPNRELGPPLEPGHKYTLMIGSGMVDVSGHPLRKGFCKRFRVTEAVRERISVERWKIVPPATKSRQPLALILPKPLDWALLLRSITIASEGGRLVNGRIEIDQGERRWSFAPILPWTAGAYSVRVASSLEDVCGNSLLGPFDRPLRAASDLVYVPGHRSMPFHVV
jgi:hypothetical protein